MAVVSIDARDATPIYAQLERGLRAAIATGRLRPAISCRPSASSPSTSSVNANTVARVYAELERAGVLETRRGVGSFVAATPAQARPPRRTRAPAARVRHPRARRTPPPPDSPSTKSLAELDDASTRKEHD